jgi:hypothetical protein
MIQRNEQYRDGSQSLDVRPERRLRSLLRDIGLEAHR